MNGPDFVALKYQAQPQLVIKECLNADDPTEEIEFAIFVLYICGQKSLANKIISLCPQYGLSVEPAVTETMY